MSALWYWGINMISEHVSATSWLLATTEDDLYYGPTYEGILTINTEQIGEFSNSVNVWAK